MDSYEALMESYEGLLLEGLLLEDLDLMRLQLVELGHLCLQELRLAL